MADTKFKVTIITPDGTVYDNDNATMVIMNTSGGQMGIMANQVRVLASLSISVLKKKLRRQRKHTVRMILPALKFI